LYYGVKTVLEPLFPPENGHFWEGGRLARLKEKPWQGCSTAVFGFTEDSFPFF